MLVTIEKRDETTNLFSFEHDSTKSIAAKELYV